MQTITVFNHVSLDGYFCDSDSDMSWAHQQDAELAEFTNENATGGSTLMFGRVTYQMMAGFWPTPAARQMMPIVAERMNRAPKIVFSRTLSGATWNNTRLINNDVAGATRALKGEEGEGITVMGSGSIVSQLAEAGLIDNLGLMVNPIVLGKGRTLFESVTKRIHFKQTNSRVFKNGLIFLSYEPA
jgi:dihydrofolate reductase